MATQTPLGHAAAQIDQVAQHIALLVAELEHEILSTELRDLAGVPLSPGGASLSDKVKELASDYAAFRGLLTRHTTVLRGLA